MIKRIQYLDKRVPMTFLYGQNTWMDQSIGEIVKKERQNSFVQIEVDQLFNYYKYRYYILDKQKLMLYF